MVSIPQMKERDPSDEPERQLESTATLLTQIRDGVPGASDRLFQRCLPLVRRWARGKLPHGMRDHLETEDLVQQTLCKALERIDRFESRHQGAFLAFLRKILQNNLIDEIRRHAGKPLRATLPPEIAHPYPSPLRDVISKEQLEAYERGLEKLSPEHQGAVLLRIECGCGWAEIAEFLGSPSPNAARMLVTRALVKLVEQMDAK